MAYAWVTDGACWITIYRQAEGWIVDQTLVEIHRSPGSITRTARDKQNILNSFIVLELRLPRIGEYEFRELWRGRPVDYPGITADGRLKPCKRGKNVKTTAKA